MVWLQKNTLHEVNLLTDVVGTWSPTIRILEELLEEFILNITPWFIEIFLPDSQNSNILVLILEQTSRGMAQYLEISILYVISALRSENRF